ncbi:hypothetical protein [Allosphingosinicella deserti]|nr:hypothetical protein [Sphingomonas deserti]
MTRAILGLGLLLATCIETPASAISPETMQVERDLVDYAMASCFAAQQNAYLKDQGRRWAGAVMQRAHGPVEQWTVVADAVEAELARSGIGKSKPDGPHGASVPMPLMACVHIPDATDVRAAIAIAARALSADYAAQPKE